MRIINVPEGKLPVIYDGSNAENKIMKQESHFWFSLKAIWRSNLERMSGAQILEIEGFYNEVIEQEGSPKLKIKRESEYEKLLSWVEQYKGWPGKVENVTAMIRAFRSAEKVKDAPTKPS